MRVLIVCDDIGPSDIVHPALFKSNLVDKELASALGRDPSFTSKAASEARLGASEPKPGVAPGSARVRQILQSMAASRMAEVEATNKGLRDAQSGSHSRIISDEGPSRETGKDTDFVVVMSAEPQGALKIRQREPLPMDWFERSPFRGVRPFWN